MVNYLYKLINKGANLMSEEKVSIKEALEEFVKGEQPEMTQEETITKYEEMKNKTSNDEDSSENTEEQEHLKRIKQELLESLARVEKLEKELFDQKEKVVDEKAKLKVNNKAGGKSSQIIREEKEVVNKEKERE